MHPILQLQNWLREEKDSGASLAQHAVLSTLGREGTPHARLVAIRDVEQEGLVFFTQSGTRKVAEIQQCPAVSLTFWFERFAREVIVEGECHLLSKAENAAYWQSYPKWAQLRFLSYAATSSQTIPDKRILEDKKIQLEKEYRQGEIPLSPHYCGCVVKPKRFVFYSFRTDALSDVIEYRLSSSQGYTWARLSP
jgi:pyridoxamine 5'-phosphate oxidase